MTSANRVEQIVWSVLLLASVTVVSACPPESASDDDAGTQDASVNDSGANDGGAVADAGLDMAPACTTLFGVPSEQTGLTEQECSPACTSCGGPFEAQTFDDSQLDAWLAYELLDSPPELTVDPYETPDDVVRDPDAVCAVQFDADNPNAYRLQTVGSVDLAERAGATVTHHGACGVCSSLEDLVAYIRNPDLTEPVRECGLLGVSDGDEANLDCLLELGFTRPCAQVWLYNTKNTRSECLEVCVAALRDPYHDESGSLNECLQCDEDVSGPVFKAVSGRTRRNSGLASGICRPCETVARVRHEY